MSNSKIVLNEVRGEIVKRGFVYLSLGLEKPKLRRKREAETRDSREMMDDDFCGDPHASTDFSSGKSKADFLGTGVCERALPLEDARVNEDGTGGGKVSARPEIKPTT